MIGFLEKHPRSFLVVVFAVSSLWLLGAYVAVRDVMGWL